MLLKRTCAVLCILMAILWGPAPPAAAQEKPGEVVDRGISLYLEGRYEKAMELLYKALDYNEKDLGRNRRLGALSYLAFCQTALGDMPGARENFKTLLTMEPDYRLPAGTSPKIVRVFEDVRSKIPKKIEPQPPIEEKPPPGVIPPEKKPEESRPKKSSSSWWIWAVVGGVLVGAGVTLAVLLSGEDEPTGNAIVDIQVIGP
jgi:tetratricopeptide (TPR) repeat protein